MAKATHTDDTAIEVRNLHKTFKIPLDGGMNLKQRILNAFRGRSGYREFSPLNGVDFEIKKGEFFGIVGRNGSGKSTLLKTIAGIYTPDKGKIRVDGVLVPFIELGVGFNPELTGRENVFLNGALLGFSREEMSAMYDEIVDFAELHDFMDERLKNYSSGMQVRLAFSIAIRAEGDILLLDEVLAVGDSSFQQKCYSYFNELKQAGRTVILVTHSMSAVERFCNRALLLDEGTVKIVGDKTEVANMYEELFVEAKNRSSSKVSTEENSHGDVDVHIDVSSQKDSGSVVRIGDEININIIITANVDVKSCNTGINIRDESGRIIFSTDTRLHVGEFKLAKGESQKINITTTNLYTDGIYDIGVHVVDEKRETGSVLFMNKKIANFTSYGAINHKHSLFHPPYRLTKQKNG